MKLLSLPEDLIHLISKKIPIYHRGKLCSTNKYLFSFLINDTDNRCFLEKSTNIINSWNIMLNIVEHSQLGLNNLTYQVLFLKMIDKIDVAIRYPCMLVKILGKIAKMSIDINNTETPNCASFLISKYYKLLSKSGYRLMYTFNDKYSKTEILVQYIGACDCENEYPCLCHGNECYKEWNYLLEYNN